MFPKLSVSVIGIINGNNKIIKIGNDVKNRLDLRAN